MHSAFHIEPVLKKSAYKITALDVWDERLVIATEEGVLLLLREQEGAHIVEFEVEETRRNFSKRPIVQMQMAQGLGVMVSLTTEIVQVNELPSLDMSAQLLKTRGAHSFSLSLDLSPAVLTVAVRNKLLFFRWDGAGFNEWKEIVLPDTATYHTTCGDSICVASGKRYMLINLTTGVQKDMFDSNSAAPNAFCLPASSELLLGRDNMSVFQDSQGRPSRKYGITWAEPASRLLYLAPYILGVLPKVVEVKLLDTQATVQSLSLRASLVAASPDSCAAFVVANNCVYRLRPVAMNRQVDALIEGQQYETCLALCQRCAPNDAAVAAKAPTVYRAYALTLFSKMDFDKAMGLFSKCPPAILDPRDVLGLYPDLAVAVADNEKDKPADWEAAATIGRALKGHKLLRAQVHLIKYLHGVRQRMAEKSESFAVGSEGAVDTALLKVLVRAEPENVQAFLQLPNSCNLEIGQTLLTDYEMYHELMCLFQTHNEHRRALDLLAQHGQGSPEGHPLHGVTATVEYLRALGSDHQQIVLEYSRWVLRTNPEMGLTIFSEPMGAATPLPVETVLMHLKAFDEDSLHDRDKGEEAGLRISYLEHIIAQGETSAQYHNALVLLYLDSVQRLKQAQSKSAGALLTAPVRYAAGKEPYPLGMRRRKLMDFLEQSSYYSPERILNKLPMVDLYEERALILSQLGEHENALSIYAHRLGDVQMAQEYCERLYDSASPTTCHVYLDLLKVYLKPPDASAPMTLQALSLMSKYFERVDAAKALDVLPPSTSLRSLLPFFESAIRQNSEVRKSLQISKALLKADHVKISQEYHVRRSRRILITGGKRCKVSQKRIGTSAFAVYPNNVVVLLGERAHPNQCPLTGRNFLENPVE